MKSVQAVDATRGPLPRDLVAPLQAVLASSATGQARSAVPAKPGA